jgi:hypothetical protein
LVLVAVVVATITDLRLLKISSFVALPLLASALVYRAIVGEVGEMTDGPRAVVFGVGIVLILFLTVIPLLAHQRGGSR